MSHRFPGALAIAGVGCAGTALLDAVSRAPAAPARIVLIDPAPSLPSGPAFVGAEPHHLLNARARQMSLRADDPRDFAAFAARTTGADAAAFLPRRLYGRYLEERFRQACAALRARRTHLSRRVGRLVAASSDDMGGLTLTLEDGRTVPRVRFLALATGPQRRPPLAEPHPRLAADPYRFDYAGAAAAFGGGEALVIGTGLTAIDAALSLAAVGWRGPITLASRRGALPLAHDARSDFASQCADQASISVLRPALSALWAAAPAGWRAERLKQGLSAWNALRHRMAPEVAAQMHALFARDAARVLTGGVASVAPGPGGVTVRAMGGEARTVALVVDARGFDASMAASPLLRTLAKAGLVRTSRTGFGLAPDGRQRVEGRGVGAPIYAMGACLVGDRLETTAVAALRTQSAMVARDLVRSARKRGLEAGVWSR